jgi:hypothetical protein
MEWSHVRIDFCCTRNVCTSSAAAVSDAIGAVMLLASLVAYVRAYRESW